MPLIPDYKKLEFEKLKIEWEHHRATEFNYSIGLITIFIFGLKYFVIDTINDNYILAIIFSFIIGGLSFSAILVIYSRIKQIDEIKRRMNTIIEESRRHR